jgi:hypothetical protein
MTKTSEKTTHPTILLLRVYDFAEPMPGNDSGIHAHTDTDSWKGFIKYAFETGSGAVIYIPSFINIGSDILKLILGGGRIHRHKIDSMAIS